MKHLIILSITALALLGCTRYGDGTVVYHRLGQTHYRQADGTIVWTTGNRERQQQVIDTMPGIQTESAGYKPYDPAGLWGPDR